MILSFGNDIIKTLIYHANILLFEDDAVLLKLYSDLLSQEHFNVQTASDSKTATEKMQSGQWDLILMDLLLPEVNGLELVKQNSALVGKSIKKIVFLTNLEKGIEIDQVKNLGYEFVIKSNLTPDQFIDKVKSLL